jgi:hypothetical protein
MTTPKKSEIIELAKQLYFNDMAKSGINNFNDPEPNELAESGYIQTAKSMLMRDQYKAQVESKDFYDLENDFQIDIELALRCGVFISGQRGCSKSNLAKTIADTFLKKGYVVRVFDNSQTWRRSSIPNLAIIKPYSNFEPQYNESYVFDISLLDIEQQKAFIENIVDREFNYTASLKENERNWRIYVFEECEILISTHDRSKKILRLCASGRNLKMSYIAVAQRFAMISTSLISLSGQLYLGMMHEFNDLKRAYNWLGENTKELQNLDVGDFIRYSNGKIDKMHTELFTPNIEPKMIIADPKPIEPLTPLPKTSDPKTTLNFIAFVMWFSAIVYVLLRGF